ncbi:hypothetical protein NQL31_003720 [Lotmaria passim]
MLSYPVYWQSDPVVLHVSTSRLSSRDNTTKLAVFTSSAPPAEDPPTATHVLFFDQHRTAVTAAALTVAVEESRPTSTADFAGTVHADRTAAPAQVIDGLETTAVLLPVAAIASVAEGEEWTDAVDDEAADFFGDDGE